MYAEGHGVKLNYAEAVKWYRAAAEQGDATAQYNLGNMYLAGQGTEKDYVQAYVWFTLAASHAVDGAERQRDYVKLGMTPEDIAKAESIAKAWRPRHARLKRK